MFHRALSITVTVLLMVCSSSAQSQEPVPAGGLERAAAARKKAIGLLEAVAEQIGSLRSAENRGRIGANVADSLWEHDQRRSRTIFVAIEEDIKAGFNEADSAYSSQMRTLRVFGQLRSEIIDRIAKRDPELALEFLQATVPPVQPQLPYEMRRNEENLALRLARQSAARNPQLALKIGRRTLANGLSLDLLPVLYQLQRTDENTSRTFHKDIVDKVKTTNLLRNWMQMDLVVQLVRTFQPPRADEEAYRDLIEVLLTTVLANGCGNAEPANAHQLCYAVGSVFPLIEKYYPARAALLKRWSGGHDMNAALSEGWAQVNEVTMNGTVEEILSLRTSYPDLQAQIYWGAIRKALNSGDVARARQIASDSPDPESRRLMLEQLGREIRTSLDAERLTMIQQEVIRLRNDEERIQVLLSAASLADAGDRKAALGLLNQAAEIVNSTKSEKTQLESQLAMAIVYCSLNSERGFSIMESLLPRLNEIVAAANTLGGLENNYFSDGEWNMSSGGGVGTLLTRLAHNAGSFARMDFDRSVALAAQFERPEIRLMAHLKIAQSVLGTQPNPSPIFPRRMVFRD